MQSVENNTWLAFVAFSKGGEKFIECLLLDNDMHENLLSHIHRVFENLTTKIILAFLINFRPIIKLSSGNTILVSFISKKSEF